MGSSRMCGVAGVGLINLTGRSNALLGHNSLDGNELSRSCGFDSRAVRLRKPY